MKTYNTAFLVSVTFIDKIETRYQFYPYRKKTWLKEEIQEGWYEYYPGHWFAGYMTNKEAHQYFIVEKNTLYEPYKVMLKFANKEEKILEYKDKNQALHAFKAHEVLIPLPLKYE